MSDEVKELLLSLINQPNTKSRNRKIIFWYDPSKEYTDSIDDLITSDNIELIKYKENSFWIRYHIEKEVPDKDIIIYFDSERKKGVENPLLDLETSNSDFIFNPDKTTMLLSEFKLDNDMYDIVKNNEKFFKDKKRRAAFSNFSDIDMNEDNINLIIISVLLGIKSISIDEIFKNIIKAYYEDEKKIDDLYKFSNVDFLNNLINNYFGSNIDTQKDLEMLFKSFVLTYFASDLDDINEISKYSNYILPKKTNVHIFVDSLMRDITTSKYFEKLSNKVVKEFGLDALIHTLDISHYEYNDAFKCIDSEIIDYICDSLNNNVNQFEKYNELINIRVSKYWYNSLFNEYEALKISCEFLEEIENYINKIKSMDMDSFGKLYAEDLYKVDTMYRRFYYYFDKIDITENFEKLRQKIENIYVNDFISKLSIKWSETLSELKAYNTNRMLMQDHFFEHYIKDYKDKKNRVIVIISDGFRYELAHELNYKLNELGGNSKLEYMQGLVPSYTQLGMASLLPHNKLSRSSNDFLEIVADGISTAGIDNREKILKTRCEESLAIKYDDLVKKTKPEWKKMFSGKKIVYIYHDKVDNTGEHDESNVFNACNDAINEINKLIEDLHKTFSGVELFVTADHGFFYKYDKLDSSDKAKKDENSIKQKTRFSYSDTESKEQGILSVNLDYVFGENSGFVNIPKGNAVFERQGTGINYIHGGLLPEEIIIPVISFKSTRNIEEAQKVKITYSDYQARQNKITNAITYLHFIQDNMIDENNKPCRYIVRFVDKDGNKISDESTIIADRTSKDIKDRIFEEKFVFKNISYENKEYYLEIVDEELDYVVESIPFIIDIAISNNFNF